ncbi:hypothetical protein ACFPOE_13575 [Caenimonas terrae]|uniref:Uncharacterized protein n=1 Tax=Caenimonas terrae TaxID=696074 RepID=A0ABW0ND56_9BURK
MAIFPNRIVRTDEGVWLSQVPPWTHACVLIALLVAAGIVAFFSRGKRLPGEAFIPAAIAAGSLVQSVRERRRYGQLGRPLVSRFNGSLNISPRVGAELKVNLSTTKKVVVYGQAGRRIYRAVDNDGSYVEIRPEWGRSEEREAIAFLENALGPLVLVEVAQTEFAAVRGDGPYYDA